MQHALLRDHHVAATVVRLDGELREHLQLVDHDDAAGWRAELCQHHVVESATLPQSLPCRCRAERGRHHQIDVSRSGQRLRRQGLRELPPTQGEIAEPFDQAEPCWGALPVQARIVDPLLSYPRPPVQLANVHLATLQHRPVQRDRPSPAELLQLSNAIADELTVATAGLLGNGESCGAQSGSQRTLGNSHRGGHRSPILTGCASTGHPRIDPVGLPPTHMRTVAIVPAYQAADSVGSVVSDLVRLWPTSAGTPAVIVVDDGSSDETAARAGAAGAIVVRHRHNRGKGAALRTGLVRARELGAEAAVTVDADGQHPAEEAVRLAEHDAPATALVLAVRDLASAGAPRPSQLSNRISNFFLSRFAGAELRDTQCGLRRYPVQGTLDLGASSDGYAYEAEVVLRAARAGWSIEQIPVRVFYPPPEERVSHFHVVRDPARIIGTVLRTLADTARPR